jgi:biotin carboxyl carrier protein
MRYITTVNEVEYIVELLNEKLVRVNDQEYKVDFASVSNQPVLTLLANNQSYQAHIFQDEHEWQILLQGTLYRAMVVDEREKSLRAAAGASLVQTGTFTLKAPMPGLVIKIPVQQGDLVEQGDVLLILESMKMQNELKSPNKGTVTRIFVEEGSTVEKKAPLVNVE